MYLQHFGLKDKPFKLTQDLAYYYGPPHQVPLNELCFSIEEEQGLALLLGGPGLGKTTILRRLLTILPPNLLGLFMSDNSLSGQSLLDHVATLLRLRIPPGQKHFLSGHLQNLARSGRRLVLLVDEAQGLTTRQLEEVRYLTNLELRGKRLVEIILAGLPSLAEVLERPEMAALRQRIAVRSTIEPLDVEHTRRYIEHRLTVAGATNGIFSPEVFPALHQKTKGIPRLIHILCDRALLAAFARDAAIVDPATLEAAAADLKIQADAVGEPGGAGAAPAALRQDVLSAIVRRLELIEEKQERLAEALRRLEALFSRSEEVASAQKRWLERLRD